MVLQNETAGGAGNCRGGARRDSDRSGEPAPGIPELDAEYPRLDTLATALVGSPHSRMVLQGKQPHHGGAPGAGEVRRVRIGKPGTGSGRAGYLVQLGAVAVFDAGLAGENGRLRKILPDEPVDHWVRHPVLLGGADDNEQHPLHGQSSVPRRVPTLTGEDL